MENCVSCKKKCGSHKCSICESACHAIAPCCEPSETTEEGFGRSVVCRQCYDKEKTSKKSQAFASFFKQPGKNLPWPLKRAKHGHENTQMGFCLSCYRNKKKRFWFSRYNKSTVFTHIKSVHKGDMTIEEDVVAEKSPLAQHALAKYNGFKSNTGNISEAISPASSQTEDLSPSSSFHSMTTPLLSPPRISSRSSAKNISEAISPASSQIEDLSPSSSFHSMTTPLLSPPRISSRSSAKLKQSLILPEINENLDLDKLAEKVAKKVQKIVFAGNSSSSTPETTPVRSKANNLFTFITEFKDFELLSDYDFHVLQCKTCKEYLTTRPPALSDAGPSGNKSGSLAKGLVITKDVLTDLKNGHNDVWYHQKARLLQHVNGEMHQKSMTYKRTVLSEIAARKHVVVNQIRTAIGIIKSKSAALQYEERIAELYAAGAAIGDFGHSRKLFPDMASVAVSYIRQKCALFLSTPLPNTGFPPHFYVSADKSTNHRKTNQVTLVCPVVNGERQGIIASVDLVYVTSDGIGGGAKELATTLLTGVQSLKFSDNLLQMQGKVMDGQYLTDGFITTINEAILRPYDLPGRISFNVSDAFWWPCQWDPSHWLDKVFSKFKGCAFVERILKRSNMYHQLFGQGKMHSLAMVMSQEQSRPIKVTNAFAHQRFLSSSYLSLRNLQQSLELYIEAYKDHDNRQDLGYKIYGCDFVTDLLGLLDLLEPLVILMKQVQAHWCPGWKLHSYVPKVLSQIKEYASSVESHQIESNACPLLKQHLPFIGNMKYGDCELVEGWLIVGEVQPGKSVNWEARDRKDCFRDLASLANGMVMELENRFTTCCPPLLKLLSNCLDFGLIFNALSGKKFGNRHPVNKRKLAAVCLEEFKKCVEFVCQLPHVQNENLEIGPEFACSILWGLKSALLEVIWGSLFHTHFQLFFINAESHFAKTPTDTNSKIQLLPSTKILEFSPSDSPSFTLCHTFKALFEDGRDLLVLLDEKSLINCMYTDSHFYNMLGQEFCLIFDIMYAKTGTESVAESFYRVMEKQEMDGPQSFEVLRNRTIVDWSLPHTVQCDEALSEMARMYIEGDKENGVRKHYVPVLKDRRCRAVGNTSKVIARLLNDKPKLPFLI